MHTALSPQMLSYVRISSWQLEQGHTMSMPAIHMTQPLQTKAALIRPSWIYSKIYLM